MYAGAGATPLLTAAAAWNGIAAELSTTAISFESVVTSLTTEQWMGPASLTMAAAVQPFLAWLLATAESSAFAAAQAMSSAAAFETAYAMIVPPAEVAANRAQMARLIATNTFGQNVPAIAATEARYSEMWAQDATAMYGYAAASATAARLNPLTRPTDIANPGGAANQAEAVAQAAATGPAVLESLSNVVSVGPDAVQSLAGPAAPESTGSLLEFLAWLDHNESPLWGTFDHNRATYWDYSVGQIGSGGGDEERDVEDEIGLGLETPFGDKIDTPGSFARSVAPAGVGATPAVAGLGKATLVGELSVPPSWTVAAPRAVVRAASDGTDWAVPVGEYEEIDATAVAPGMVATASGSGGAAPRYGVKPIVMPSRGF